jgi:hypothetical protein
MDEPQVTDDSTSNNTFTKVDNYFSPHEIPPNINSYTDVTGTTQKTKPQYIEYSKIARFNAPYNSFIKLPNIKFNTSHITMNSVNHFMKGLVLLLANASLFVPIAQIGGKKTKKNKAKK